MPSCHELCPAFPAMLDYTLSNLEPKQILPPLNPIYWVFCPNSEKCN